MNKDTTAMHDLISTCNVNLSHSKESTNDLYEQGLIRAFRYVKEMIETKLLSKEREQILDAFVAGDERGTKGIPFNAEQYYNQTYNN